MTFPLTVHYQIKKKKNLSSSGWNFGAECSKKLPIRLAGCSKKLVQIGDNQKMQLLKAAIKESKLKAKQRHAIERSHASRNTELSIIPNFIALYNQSSTERRVKDSSFNTSERLPLETNR